MIELYVVPAAEDAAFLDAFEADAPKGLTLYKALRDDVRHRFAAIDGPARDGALLITPATLDLTGFEGRQGHLSTERHDDLQLVHWSSPLMYARAADALGDPLRHAEKALYSRI